MFLIDHCESCMRLRVALAKWICAALWIAILYLVVFFVLAVLGEVAGNSISQINESAAAGTGTAAVDARVVRARADAGVFSAGLLAPVTVRGGSASCSKLSPPRTAIILSSVRRPGGRRTAGESGGQ